MRCKSKKERRKERNQKRRTESLLKTMRYERTLIEKGYEIEKRYERTLIEKQKNNSLKT